MLNSEDQKFSKDLESKINRLQYVALSNTDWTRREFFYHIAEQLTLQELNFIVEYNMLGLKRTKSEFYEICRDEIVGRTLLE